MPLAQAMGDAPKKRGRPRLTEEEKRKRAAEKAARPRKRPGPKPGSKRKKATKPKAAPVVMLAAGADDARIEGKAPQEEQRRGPGNPGKYKPEFVEQARKLSEAGFTDEQMADWFEICIRTFYNWTAKHPDFLQAIKMAKDAPDDRTERSLYHRANGYEWTEEVPTKVKDIEYENGRKLRETERVVITKVKRFTPPDPTSSIFWLKNRRPGTWRDKKEVEVNPHEDWLSKVAAMEGAD